MSAITNVVEIVTQGNVAETGGSSKSVWNVWHYFQNPNAPGPQSAVAVANVFLTSVWANIAAQLSIAWVGSATLARYLDDVTFPLLSANVPATGSLALPRLSTGQAVVILRRSATRGKNFRGSQHFGPLAAAQVVADELTAGGVTAWTALLATIAGNITVGGQTYSPCIVSKSLSQLRQNPVTIQGSAITQALLNKTIGTMRRRKERTVR